MPSTTQAVTVNQISILTGAGIWKLQIQPLHPVDIPLKTDDLCQGHQFAGGGGRRLASLGRVSGPLTVPAHKGFAQVDR